MPTFSRIFIFGATGVIGQSCLKTFPPQAQLVGFSYYHNQTLATTICQAHPEAQAYSAQTNHDYERMIAETQPDLIVNALAGMEGFQVSLLAAKHHIHLALANKESMVMAGWWLKQEYDFHHLFLSIIDSEHTSIEMLVQHQPRNQIKDLYLTCSGGPYYQLTQAQRDQLMCPATGLTHPTWTMGPKITFDSATLFNKAFEMIEAYYLFQTQNIYALYHPQSIVHALIGWSDNTIAFLGSSKSMDFATAYVLNHNTHPQVPQIAPLDFHKLNLKFDHMCEKKWPPLKWARQVIHQDKKAIGIIMVVLDDYLYDLFTNHQIQFGEIYRITQSFIDRYQDYQLTSIDDVLAFYQVLKQAILVFDKEYKKI